MHLITEAPGAFEKVIFRRRVRDFWMDLAIKDEGILCVFRIFHKPKPAEKIRSSGENHF
jgi:hypothetical protein